MSNRSKFHLSAEVLRKKEQGTLNRKRGTLQIGVIASRPTVIAYKQLITIDAADPRCRFKDPVIVELLIAPTIKVGRVKMLRTQIKLLRSPLRFTFY